MKCLTTIRASTITSLTMAWAILRTVKTVRAARTAKTARTVRTVKTARRTVRRTTKRISKISAKIGTPKGVPIYMYEKKLYTKEQNIKQSEESRGRKT